MCLMVYCPIKLWLFSLFFNIYFFWSSTQHLDWRGSALEVGDWTGGLALELSRQQPRHSLHRWLSGLQIQDSRSGSVTNCPTHIFSRIKCQFNICLRMVTELLQKKFRWDLTRALRRRSSWTRSFPRLVGAKCQWPSTITWCTFQMDSASHCWKYLGCSMTVIFCQSCSCWRLM